jgi:predicted helicase
MHLRELLEKYRQAASSEREKGTYFERLVKVWLENAPTDLPLHFSSTGI